jgi:hypothetical protein
MKPSVEPNTRELLARAAALDPESWAPPLVGKLALRRLKAIEKAKAELEAERRSSAPGGPVGTRNGGRNAPAVLGFRRIRHV